MRVAGVELRKAKRMDVARTYIYGIGPSSARKILGEARVDGAKKTDDVSDEEQVRIRQIIDNSYKVEGDLRRELQQAVKRLMDLGCYRGLRHRRGLPVRGQRTHTNARTRKGPRKVVAGKKQAPSKG